MASIRYQYYQTYILYDGLASGFCSVFTSFGQFIIQLDILFWNRNGILKAFFHFFGTIVMSFLAYWLGRKIARKMKKGIRFVKYMNKLEHDHERMQFEVMYWVSNMEQQEYQERESGAGTNIDGALISPMVSAGRAANAMGRRASTRRHRKKSPSMHITSQRSRIIHHQFMSQQRRYVSGGVSAQSPLGLMSPFPASHETSPLLSTPPSRNAFTRSSPNRSPSTIHSTNSPTAGSDLLLSPFSEKQSEKFYTAVMELEDHLHVQLDKKRRHTSKDLQPRDFAVIGIIAFIIVFVTAMVILAQVFQFNFLTYVVDSGAKELIWFEYVMALFWSVSGAFSGRIIGGIGLIKRKKTVQWPTFRVNLLSCILIGSAHNILLFRHYFPYGDHPMFDIVFRRFIIDFCGSESSFCGLIDETSKLWRTKSISKMTAIRNFMFNLIICVMVFLLVVYSVRIAFFYDLRLLWRR